MVDAWHPIDTAPEDVEVMTCIRDADGDHRTERLTRRGPLWYSTSGSMPWVEEGSAYVYDAPTHWRPLEDIDG